MEIILASRSPRRRELFKKITDRFIVAADDSPELSDGETSPAALCKRLADCKARHIFAQNPDCAVIGCDTVVALDGEIFGKPDGSDDAFRMLRALSGRTHRVHTGVSIITPDVRRVFSVATAVEFYKLGDDEISRYIATGEPFDKAGGYGIQDGAAIFVKGIRGDYFNVMGLPVARLYRELKKLAIIR